MTTDFDTLARNAAAINAEESDHETPQQANGSQQLPRIRMVGGASAGRRILDRSLHPDDIGTRPQLTDAARPASNEDWWGRHGCNYMQQWVSDEIRKASDDQ